MAMDTSNYEPAVLQSREARRAAFENARRTATGNHVDTWGTRFNAAEYERWQRLNEWDAEYERKLRAIGLELA